MQSNDKIEKDLNAEKDKKIFELQQEISALRKQLEDGDGHVRRVYMPIGNREAYQLYQANNNLRNLLEDARLPEDEKRLSDLLVERYKIYSDAINCFITKAGGIDVGIRCMPEYGSSVEKAKEVENELKALLPAETTVKVEQDQYNNWDTTIKANYKDFEQICRAISLSVGKDLSGYVSENGLRARC